MKTILLIVAVWAAMVAGVYTSVKANQGITPVTFNISELCQHGAFKPLCGDVIINTGDRLTVVGSGVMQPFGVGAEDDDTAELHVQGTRSPQVTRHGGFLQGSL
jgi:hypothetical protein